MNKKEYNKKRYETHREEMLACEKLYNKIHRDMLLVRDGVILQTKTNTFT